MLLILDNFEHLLGGVGLVTEMLEAAPHVRILATSRARLNLQGEQLLPVTGMSLPDSAVELFVASARRVQPDFALTADNLADVIHICRLVEGMPLGLLLAAAWVQTLSPATIAAQISRSLDFLEADLHDLPERQRSVRAVFDHSWRLLTEREQEVFRGLSVFRGGFTWQAAQQVAGASLQELRGLVEKSLLHRMLTPSIALGTGDRFEMHELLRQYAEERLDQEPVASQAVHERLCACYTSALQQWTTDLKGPRQQQALAEMDAEAENARGAWNWAVARGQVERLDRAMDGLCLFYMRRTRYEEGAAACRVAAESLQAIASDDGSRVRARALAWQSGFEQELGRIQLAGQLLRQSLDLVERLGSSGQDMQAERAFVLLRMGEAVYDSDCPEAGRLFEQSLALYRTLGDRWRMAHVLRALGSIALNVGEYQRAKQLYEESLAIRRALGDPWGIANSLQGLGRVALSLGEIEEGERLVREGIAISEGIGDQAGIVKGLGNLGVLLPWSGKFAEAQALLEKSRAICEDMGFRVGLVYALAHLSVLKVNLGEYEPARSLAYQCRTLAREISHAWALGYSLIVLGCIALVERDYDGAWQFSQDSLSVYREAGQQETAGYALVLSAVAALRLGQLSLARRSLREALRVVAASGAFDSSVTALAAAALFLIEQGQPERAVELYATASRYGLVSSSCFFQNVFGRPIAAAAAGLPPEVVAAARERGQARDLATVVADLLTEVST
jgi:predicted ATPase